jgi:glycogen debranching enzyme
VAHRVSAAKCQDLSHSSRLEWLLTNGIGGFAMGTVGGIATRRYHGHLIAATRPPAERTLLLAAVEASVQGKGAAHWLSANEYPGAIFPEGFRYLESFAVGDSAEWTYRVEGLRMRKRLALHPGQNACTIAYDNLSDEPVLLVLRPLVAHRSYHASFHESAAYPAGLEFPKDQTAVEHGGVKLVLNHPGAQRLPVQGWYYRFEHARDRERGLDASEDLYCPCELRFELRPGESAVWAASEGGPAKPISIPRPGASRSDLRSRLELAVAPFLVHAPDRASLLAGYPWFTDWGRDTMISLPGACLETGRIETAREVLRSYARRMEDGLIPNRFLDERTGAEYNTADATLWFVQAVHRTLEADWEPVFALEMFEVLKEVYQTHVLGAPYGIRVDPDDGLLTQGEPGMQLTWMDVRIENWVVTPRHGKPVEINGLWINALRILERLAKRLKEPHAEYGKAARRAASCFERKFWCESRGHYFDTVDPYDASLRPNQVIAMALPFGPAHGENARRALRLVRKELLTPVGLRTLGPQEPGYRGRFQGPLRELDAAYHQGTVWPWLLGPYVSAVLRVTGDRAEARRALKAVPRMLGEYGLGGIPECYDGDAPRAPGGCPWQAWSAAEALRAWNEVNRT